MQMNKAATQSKAKYKGIADVTNSKQQAWFWSMFILLGQKAVNTISLGTCLSSILGTIPNKVLLK